MLEVVTPCQSESHISEFDRDMLYCKGSLKVTSRRLWTLSLQTAVSIRMEQNQTLDTKDSQGRYTLIRDEEELKGGIFDKPLPCFGCGIGWFSFLLGFVFPLMWYFATILYFGNYYRKDPRERAGLAASAIAALVCSVVAMITIAALVF